MECFTRLETLGIGYPGQRILDLGTGTGLLGRAFARRGCVVTGLDPSRALLAEARKADAETGLSIEYMQGRAEKTGLPDASFEVVAAATSWRWFDRPGAALESRRLLRPDGRLLIAALDRHFRPGKVVAVTWELIDRLNPAEPGEWHAFQYPIWTEDLVAAGFGDWDAFAFTTVLTYTHDAWIGRIRASNRVGPSMDDGTLRRFEIELRDILAKCFPEDPLLVDHRVSALVAWSRNEPREKRG